jgi:hypothetical protein
MESTTMKRIIVLTLLACLTAPLLAQPETASPEQPSGEPEGAEPGSVEPRRGVSPTGEPRFPGTRDRSRPDWERGFGASRNPRVWQRFAPGEPIDDATWARVEPFLRDNGPNRFAIYSRLVEKFGADSQQVRVARQRIGGRVRALEHLAKADPEMHEIAIEQFRLEDQIIAAMRKAQRQPSEASRDEVRAQVRALVINNFREREARLDRLRNMLVQEERLLLNDRDRLDDLTERQVSRFREELQHFADAERPGHAPRREGEGLRQEPDAEPGSPPDAGREPE